MTKHHRGNVSLLHNTLQNMLVDILEERTRARIYKELPVPSKLELGKTWVVDVADLSDPKHPIYYEVETSMTKSTKLKVQALAHHAGTDLHVVSIQQMHRDLGKNPGIRDVERWLRGLVH